jgi:hypothetical protein
VIATHGKIEPLRVGVPTSFNLAHAPPMNLCRVAVLLVAGHNAALATHALGHVKVEAVLLAILKRSLR